MATAHMRAHGVDVRHEEQIAAVERDSDGRVSAIVTHKGERIECQLLGVCIGVEPCMAWLSSVKTPPAMGRGICVDSQLRTSLPDVWAAGDCAEIRFEGADARPPLVEQIWYSAKRQGELVGKNLTGASLRYQPPLFFNSAKLFDIEYTTVGDVSRPPPGTRTLYRRDGKRPLSQRILFLDDRVIGFNLLGSRWDHTVLARWIDEHRDIEWVQDHLGDAQFDVELGRADLGRMTERELAIVGDSAPGERS